MKNTGKFRPELQEKYGFCLNFMSCLYRQGISFNACESQNQGQITEISLITKINPKTQGFEKRIYLKSKRIWLSIEKLNMNKKSVVESSSKIYYLYSA